jgi:hypothetical protein
MPGDSGGPVFVPGHGAPGYFTDYEIAGVVFCRDNDPDLEYHAARADQFASWFDTQLDTAWDQFDAPSQILASLATVL